MYDFSPFYETCKRLDVKPVRLREAGIVNSATLAKIGRNEHVELETIAKICRYLKVPIEHVVRIVIE